MFFGDKECSDQSALLRSPLMPNRFLLFVQKRVEHGLLDVHFVCASVRVDEGISGALLELRVLFLQVVLGRVVAERHITCKRTHERERMAELSDDLWRQCCWWSQTAADDHVVIPIALLCFHVPGRTAAGVTRS